MTELRVNLDFACHACRQPIGVIVHCAGSHLDENAKVLARVAVPCPCCGHANPLVFEPNGTVHSVAPVPTSVWIPTPSVN